MVARGGGKWLPEVVASGYLCGGFPDNLCEVPGACSISRIIEVVSRTHDLTAPHYNRHCIRTHILLVHAHERRVTIIARYIVLSRQEAVTLRPVRSISGISMVVCCG